MELTILSVGTCRAYTQWGRRRMRPPSVGKFTLNPSRLGVNQCCYPVDPNTHKFRKFRHLFYSFQLATLAAAELQILLLQNAAAVQPKEQASPEKAPLHKEKKKSPLHLNVTLPSPHTSPKPFASHPPIRWQHSSPPHLCFLTTVTHPGLALPRQPPPPLPSPHTHTLTHTRPSFSSLLTNSSRKQPVVKNRALVKKLQECLAR